MKEPAKFSIDGPDITFIVGLSLVPIFAAIHYCWPLPSTEDMDALEGAVIAKKTLEAIILAAMFIFSSCGSYFRATALIGSAINKEIKMAYGVWRATVMGIELCSPIFVILACRVWYGS